MSTAASLIAACWNTQWHRLGSPKGRLLRAALDEVAADVICLPEAQHDFLSDTHHGIWSDPDHGYPVQPDRSKVTLWSRWPWRDVDAIGDVQFPPGRYIAGTTSTPLGELRVIGLCIPWRNAHVTHGARNRAPWEDHRAYLQVLSRVLSREQRQVPVLLMGDFNQRLPRRWVPEDLAKRLHDSMREFEVWTVGIVPGLTSQLLCHIAGAGLGVTPGSIRGLPRHIDAHDVSDHDGVCASFSVSRESVPASLAGHR